METAGNAEASESGSAEAKGIKRKGHASRACNACRRRKTKCSEDKPSCRSCENTGAECVYASEHDGRRPANKSYVDALEMRISFLESLLRESGINESGSEAMHNSSSADGQDRRVKSKRRATIGDGDGPVPEAVGSNSEEEGVDATDLPVDRLKLDDDTGELHMYGPTSAFRHIPDRIPSTGSNGSSPASPASPQSLPSASRAFFGSPDTAALASPSSSRPVGTSSGDAFSGLPRGPVDWRRNLPDMDGIDEDLHGLLLDGFFTYFCNWCCWTNSVLFRRDFALCCSVPVSPQSSRTSFYSPLLHNAVLALATSFSDDPRIKGTDAGTRFATKCKSYIEDEAERPMLSTVQGLMCLGSFYSGSARHGIGWLYAGMGMRMSTTLGLGIDCSAWVSRGLVSEVLRDQRDTTFYCCYIQDKLWSLYVGRGASITKSSFETPLPRVDPVSDAVRWKPLSGAASPEPGLAGPSDFDFAHAAKMDKAEGVPNLVTLNFQWTCRLAMLAEKIMESVYGLRANIYSAKAQSLVSDLHLGLEKWLTDLPPPLQISAHSTKIPAPHVIMLHAMFHFMSILLHRPFYSRQHSKVNLPINDLAIKRCDKAATKIVSLLELFQKVPGLRYAPISLTQITFTAGTIHLLSSVNPPRAPKRVSTALAAAKTCVASLEEMGKAFKCATQSGGILSRLIDEWSPELPKPVAHPASDPTNVARQALDPHSDLAKQLLELGWTPPVAPAPTQTAHSQIIAPHAQLTVPSVHSESGGTYSPFMPMLPQPISHLSTPFQPGSNLFPPLQRFSEAPTEISQPSIAAGNPFSDEGIFSLLEGSYTAWQGLPPLGSGWAFGGASMDGRVEDQWLEGLNMDL